MSTTLYPFAPELNSQPADMVPTAGVCDGTRMAMAPLHMRVKELSERDIAGADMRISALRVASAHMSLKR